MQLEAIVNKLAHSNWVTLIVPVTKTDCAFRFCVDCRHLNAATMSGTSPLVRVDNCIESLGEAKPFTALDARWEYIRATSKEEDSDKTTFTTHFGHFSLQSRAIWLSDCPYYVPRHIKYQPVRSSTEDVFFLFSYSCHFFWIQSPTCHLLIYMYDKLILIRQARVTLKLLKCYIFHKKMSFLSYW